MGGENKRDKIIEERLEAVERRSVAAWLAVKAMKRKINDLEKRVAEIKKEGGK